ncbi:MAG: hypothetical protein ACI3ZB_00110 [Prevotella sp.]
MLLLLLLVFGSCTLSLDDYENEDGNSVPIENGDGIVSPKTEVSEFGYVTYQFNDGVRILNERYLPYIITAYRDTATAHSEIYLSKNVPVDLVPSPGELMGSTLVDHLGYTISDRVLTVTDVGNAYCVTSEMVPLKVVFKELEFQIVADIVRDTTLVESPSRGSEQPLQRCTLRGAYQDYITRGLDEIFSKEFTLTSTYFAHHGGSSTIMEDLAAKRSWKQKFSDFMNDSRVEKELSVDGTDIAFGLETRLRVAICWNLFTLFDVKVTMVANQIAYFLGKRIQGHVSAPICCTGDLSIPKQGDFPAHEYIHNKFFIPALPLSAGLSLKAIEASINVGYGLAFDYVIDAKSSSEFYFSDENEYELLHWNLFSSSEKKYVNSEKPSKVIYESSGATGTARFKRGVRLTSHVDFSISAGFTTGIYQGPSINFYPWKLNLDSYYSHVVRNNPDNCKPASLKTEKYEYKATEEVNNVEQVILSNSLEAGSLDLGTLTNDAADFFLDLKTTMTAMKVLLGSGVVWYVKKSPFPIFETKVNFISNKLSDKKIKYKCNVYVPLNTHDKCNKYNGSAFRFLHLLIFDKNYNYIKRADPVGSDNIDNGEKAFKIFKQDNTYTFEYTLDTEMEVRPGDEYYVVPAYYECSQYKGGAVDGVWTVKVPFAGKPYETDVYGNYACIRGIRRMKVTNYGSYCGSGYRMDGVAVDAEIAFPNIKGFNYVGVRVEFFDPIMRVIKKKDYEYPLDKRRSVSLKQIYLIKHHENDYVGSCRISLFYKDPKKQNAPLPDDRLTFVDELEADMVFRGSQDDYDEGEWQTYDMMNHKEWDEEGYRRAN